MTTCQRCTEEIVPDHKFEGHPWKHVSTGMFTCHNGFTREDAMPVETDAEDPA